MTDFSSCLQMAQELGISEKDSDFQNPFKVDHPEVSSGGCGHVCWATEAGSCRGWGACGGVGGLWTWSQTCPGLGPGTFTHSLVPVGQPLPLS